MVKVTLHGALGKRFGEEHSFAIQKPLDALRALMANKKGFKHAFKTWGRKGLLYEIICDGEIVSSEQMLNSGREMNEIEIAPVIMGSSNAAKTIIGAIIIVISLFMDPSGTTGLAIQGAIQGAGASLLISGIMGLLFPPPPPQFQSEAASRSFIFSTLENSATQGSPVPLGYGRLKIGTKVISTVVEPQRLHGDGPWAGGKNNGVVYLPDHLRTNWQNNHLDWANNYALKLKQERQE
jgi:predicted phage tail protein